MNNKNNNIHDTLRETVPQENLGPTCDTKVSNCYPNENADNTKVSNCSPDENADDTKVSTGKPDGTSAYAITPEEIGIAKFCIEYALSRGATSVRVSLGKNTLDSVTMINGQAENVSHCADRGIYLTLFADGRYGGYSTNRLDRESLTEFIDRALENTRMLASDPCRCLPDKEICSKTALTGNELGLSDPAYNSLTATDRLKMASDGSRFDTLREIISKSGDPDGRTTLSTIRKTSDSMTSAVAEDKNSGPMVETQTVNECPASTDPADKSPDGKIPQNAGPKITTENTTGFESFKGNRRLRIISEECEWSDSTDDSYIADSQGFEGRHRETSFNYWTEMTIEDVRGRKYSGYHWESSPFLGKIDITRCSAIALQRAANAINPRRIGGGKYTLVVENTSASRLVAPILNALSATAIQQNNSFLNDSIGRKVFSEDLNIYDFATTPKKCGSRLFDSEGLSVRERYIIRNGTVEMYFVNTYMSRKMGLEPTVEGPSRPTVLPFLKGQTAMNSNEGITENTGMNVNLEKILEFCDDGILVTGFNGGNCNQTTGNFSYGVEGYRFSRGRIQYPVKELLITGNMITLWNSLIAAGADAKVGTRWQIPTLAFSGVDFSA